MGKLICITFAECVQPHRHATSLIALEETGGLPICLEAVIDARSVFDALAAKEVRPSSEISLIMVLHQVKESLLSHMLSRLWWVDTRDMCADGLNKGSCSREGLMTLANSGQWNLVHKAVSFVESRHVPVKSIRSLLNELGQSAPAD